MRFCEYFEDYRLKKGYTYIDIARQTIMNPKSVAAHCHGKSFPHFETFADYIRCGVLDYADLVNTVSPGRTYETMYDAIPGLYYYFKREERIYRSRGTVTRAYLRTVLERSLESFGGFEVAYDEN